MVVLLTVPHTVKFKDIRQYVRCEIKDLEWPFELGAIVKNDDEFYDGVRARSTSKEEQQYAKICAIAIKKGGICLSTKCLGYRVPMHFRCGEGHEFDATPEAIDQPEHRGPRFCPECGGTRRKTEQELTDLVESCGYRFLSVSSRSVGGRMRRYIVVVCPNDHQFETLWDNFRPKNGKPTKGCAKCDNIRKTENAVRSNTSEWQKLHNLTLQGRYVNQSTKHEWVCGRNHTIKATYSSLRQKATPCTPCRLNKIAEAANLKLLTSWDKNEHDGATQFRWKCNHCGNDFAMSIIVYGRRKHACPHCDG